MTDTAMAARRPKIAIVGGGIGGLFAANALIARGFEVAVYEQAAALGEVGAGVALTPNSVRHLRRLGLEPAVEKWGVRFGPGSHYFRHDGTPIAPVQVTNSSGWSAMFGMHRADLVNFLAAALPASITRTGHRCTGFTQNRDSAQVTFANGAVVEADIVVGADGIHSELRPYVAVESTPQFHGTIAYRGTFPHERMPDWPMDRWQMWLGPGKHFLAFPLRAGQLINYVGFVPADEEMEEVLVCSGRPGGAARRVRRMGPAHRGAPAECRYDLPLGAIRSGAAADVDRGSADTAWRCRASDASPSRTGRQPIDRRRDGARDDLGARRRPRRSDGPA